MLTSDIIASFRPGGGCNFVVSFYLKIIFSRYEEEFRICCQKECRRSG